MPNSLTSQDCSFSSRTEVAALMQQSTCGDLSGIVVSPRSKQAGLYGAILLAAEQLNKRISVISLDSHCELELCNDTTV